MMLVVSKHHNYALAHEWQLEFGRCLGSNYHHSLDTAHEEEYTSSAVVAGERSWMPNMLD